MLLTVQKFVDLLCLLSVSGFRGLITRVICGPCNEGYDSHTVYSVHTIHSVYTVYNLHTINIVLTVYTVHIVRNINTVHTNLM